MTASVDAAAPELDVTGLKGEPVASLAIAAGATITDAAAKAHISERTVRRRLEIPEYRMEVSRLRSKLLDAAIGQLVAGPTAAVATLIDLLDAKSENVRATAAKAIIDYGLSLQEALETQTRIETLEELYVQQRTMRFESWRPEPADA